MIEVKKKYVYEIDQMENYYGMIPLDAYISLSYFNSANEKDWDKILIEVPHIVNFLTECVCELFMSRMSINLKDFEPTHRDFYLGALPVDRLKTPTKALLIKCQSKTFLVSEINSHSNESLKPRDLSKEQMMSIMLSCHNYAVTFVADVVRKCNNSKKVNVIGIDEIEEEEKEAPKKKDNVITSEKFDLKNYEKI